VDLSRTLRKIFQDSSDMPKILSGLVKIPGEFSEEKKEEEGEERKQEVEEKILLRLAVDSLATLKTLRGFSRTGGIWNDSFRILAGRSWVAESAATRISRSVINHQT